jgi:hypothetical protein
MQKQELKNSCPKLNCELVAASRACRGPDRQRGPLAIRVVSGFFPAPRGDVDSLPPVANGIFMVPRHHGDSKALDVDCRRGMLNKIKFGNRAIISNSLESKLLQKKETTDESPLPALPLRV